MATITIIDALNIKSAGYETTGINIESICDELKRIGGKQIKIVYERF